MQGSPQEGTIGAAPCSRVEPSSVMPGFGVVAAARYPLSAGPAQLPNAVAQLFASHFPSVTSVKKACRRGDIMVNGKAGNNSRLAAYPVCGLPSCLHA